MTSLDDLNEPDTADGRPGAATGADRATDAPRSEIDAETWLSRLPTVRWDRLFVALALLFGLFFAIATPPLQEHDAANHVVRIDEITKGRLAQPIDSDGNVAPTIDACTRAFLVHHTERGAAGQPLDFGGNWAAVPCTAPGPGASRTRR